MTPFGQRVRELRRQRGMTLRDLADELGVSAAYLSALEHGRRGRPSWWLVQRVITVFNIIWDEAEELVELARLSHPKPVIDTSGLSPRATLLANRLAEELARLDEEVLEELLRVLDAGVICSPADVRTGKVSGAMADAKDGAGARRGG